MTVKQVLSRNTVTLVSKNIRFSFIWFHSICWFLFYLNSAWRRIAADIEVKHAQRLQGIKTWGKEGKQTTPHHGDTVVTSGWLTGGKISSPSQP